MKCIECGHELKDGAIFCIRCGAMQVSMDGKRIEPTGDWPKVEAQAGASGYRSSTDGALHSAQSKTPKGFKPAPKRNGGKIAIIVIIVIAAIVAGVFAFVNCSGMTSSGSSSAATQNVTGAASGSSASTSSSTTSASASSTSASASSAAASASAESASASAAAGSAAAGSAASQTTTQEPAAQPEPEPEPVYYNDYYVLPESSYYYYSWDELSGLSTYDLFIARNEIFARHGRMFNRSDLQDYFNSQAWYEPLYTPAQWDSMGNQLNDAELKNVSLMKQVEESKGSPYL